MPLIDPVSINPSLLLIPIGHPDALQGSSWIFFETAQASPDSGGWDLLCLIPTSEQCVMSGSYDCPCKTVATLKKKVLLPVASYTAVLHVFVGKLVTVQGGLLGCRLACISVRGKPPAAEVHGRIGERWAVRYCTMWRACVWRQSK